jgi:eukaryotic-like serine/threonine-protein kinase
MAGAAITVAGLIPLIAVVHFPGWGFSSRLATPPYNYLVAFDFLMGAFPISMAYAILRRRIFDLRVMIRQGVRYAAARGALLSLVPLIMIAFAADLLLHRHQPLGEILNRRVTVYIVLTLGALLLHRYRKAWLDTLDRHFFREQYNAQRVLRDVIDEIRKARSFDKAAPGVVLQIEAALHPEFAALLVRQPGDTAFRDLAARDRPRMAIESDSKLIGLVRVLGKPVQISPGQTGWPWDHLPDEEGNFLRQSRLEWLFPICLVDGQSEVLLAVGPKRSESPYSREDQELLEGIASSLALLLEQSPGFGTISEGFKECPECGSCYDSDSGSCLKEGAKLTPFPFSRIIAHRYRFEQRLGAGGMGIVYRSFDTELERNVAIKLIHGHLVANPEAAARFRQEARAAASFTHPNVVTVYDFGVADGRRPYLVMELLSGATLRQEIGRSQLIPANRTSLILSDICAAVDAAHRQRMLHRDLKPENIFLSNSGGGERAKVLDFGVVKFLVESETDESGDQTEPGRLIGTLKYMSPEELQGSNPSESWDLWALAVIAYEMLSGIHPFAGSTRSEIRLAILNGRLTPLHEPLPGVPARWQQFFDKALAFNPEFRPKTALQFLSDFKRDFL